MLVLSVALLEGCASIVSGTNQSVSVETPGCPGASCKLTNDKGTWYVANTPGSVTVHRAYGDLTVVCEKSGKNSDGVGAVSSSTKGMAFGNILFGGIIGAGVDVGTGAAYDYPSNITVPMDCSEDGAPTIKAALAADKVATSSTAALDAGNTGPEEEGTVQGCIALEEKIQSAKDKPFTSAVLTKKYETQCDTVLLDAASFSSAHDKQP